MGVVLSTRNAAGIRCGSCDVGHKPLYTLCALWQSAWRRTGIFHVAIRPGVQKFAAEEVYSLARESQGATLWHGIPPSRITWKSRGAFVSQSNVVRGPLYFTPEQLSEICGVTVRTAYRWKSGRDRIPRLALRLLALHTQRRVLGKEWDGWLINGNTLVDPEGQSTTQGQLRAYAHVYALCRELARQNDKASVELLDRLVAMAG